MTKRERILRNANFEEVDRVPTLGGWLTSEEHYQALSRTTPEEFWADPEKVAIKAHQRLDVDGLIGLFLPPEPGRYRGLTKESVEERGQRYHSPEDVLEYINNLPSPDSLEKAFDAQAFYERTVEDMTTMQEKVGDIVWMPARWDSCCHFMWYTEFGYDNYLMALALYPDAVRKLFEYSAEEVRLRNLVLCRAFRDYDFPPLILLGQDICGSQGPMASPKVLEEIYFPNARISLEPLHQAGIKTVWHCDGNVMPILDQILDLGVSGLQGFQEELDVRLSELAKRRTHLGERLIFFGSISVSHTLPHGTVGDVKRAVEYSIESTDGGKGLFILPANTICPEVPLVNITTMYEYPRQKRVR